MESICPRYTLTEKNRRNTFFVSFASKKKEKANKMWFIQHHDQRKNWLRSSQSKSLFFSSWQTVSITMGSVPAQPAPPARAPDPVRPVREAPAKPDLPKRRSPMVHVGLGTIKLILKSMTEVKVGSTILSWGVCFLWTITRRMWSLFHPLQSRWSTRSSMLLEKRCGQSTWIDPKVALLQNWSLCHLAHWSVKRSISSPGNQTRIALD